MIPTLDSVDSCRTVASVDYETDRKIQDTIASEFKDRTILCIAREYYWRNLLCFQRRTHNLQIGCIQ